MEGFGDCITLIGAGGVGGPVALQVARLIPLFSCKRFVIYDFDTVEERNLEGQVYSREDVGHLKVEALRHHFYGLPYGECSIEYKAEYVTEDTPLRGIVIVAVDNLEARQAVYNALDYQKGKGNIVPLLIEARIGENYGLIYILDPNDPEQMARYRKEVFWGEEDVEDPNVDDRCVPARLGTAFGGVIAEILVKFWGKWRPLKVKMGYIDFGDFPTVNFTDLA